jgi:hypothetical protein
MGPIGTGDSVPMASVAGLRSSAVVLAESDPSVAVSSAAAVGTELLPGKKAVAVPVATAPIAAADAMTVVRNEGPVGGGEPAIR